MGANFGKLLLMVGLAIAAVGALLTLGGRWRWLRLGRLPGDIAYHRDGFSFYMPLGTMLLLSLLFTLAAWFIGLVRR